MTPKNGLWLKVVHKYDFEIMQDMAVHYSKPRGFVGRSICYAIMFGEKRYGHIVGGSATKFLPGRVVAGSLNNGVNNIFFHITPNGKYPVRNFMQKVLRLYRKTVERDWFEKYRNIVLWHESLVEPPRIGECYIRDGWEMVGKTKGFTCKRVSGREKNGMSGKRVWDTKNLRPKLVFIKFI